MKYRFFSVLMILVMVASLCVIAIAPAAAQVNNINVTVSSTSAGKVASYTITFVAPGGVAVGEAVTITMPGDLSGASLAKTAYTIGGADPASVSVSGQELTLVLNPTGGTAVAGGGVCTVIITQQANIKNPKLSQESTNGADFCADAAPDNFYKIKVRTEQDPNNVELVLSDANVQPEVDDYIAASVTKLAPGQESTVTGGGFTPGYTVILNSLQGGALQGQATVGSDGTFTITAIATGNGGTVTATDGTGRCASVGGFTVLPSLSVDPTSGLSGDQVTITGKNYSLAAPPITTGGLFIQGATQLMNPLGIPLTNATIMSVPAGNPRDVDTDLQLDDFQVQAIIPATLPGGVYEITCADLDGGTVPVATFTVAQRQVSVDPPAGAPGSNIVMNGVGWPARLTGGTAIMMFGNSGAFANMTAVGAIETDDTGAFTFGAQVPGIATDGIHGVIVYFILGQPNGAAYNALNPNLVQAQASFAVTSRALTIVPESGPFGTGITISGGGMIQTGVAPTTATVQVNRNNWTDIGGGALPPAVLPLNSSGDIIPDSADAVSNAAACAGLFQVGKNNIVATDNATGGLMTAAAVFTVTRPTIELDLLQGPRGTQIVIRGAGWLPGETNFVTLELDKNGNGQYQTVAIATPDAQGNIYQTTKIPSDIVVVGQNTQVSFRGRDNNCNQSLIATFTVTKPAIEVDPVSGPPGTQVRITGEGFLPQAMVGGITIGAAPGAPMVRVDNLPITDATGAFDVMGNVPGLAAGGHAITANVAGVAVTASFTITEGEGGDINVADALATIDGLYTRMWTFDGATQQFLVYDTDPNAPSDYTTMTKGQGYWLEVTQDCVLNFGAHTYNLFKGWNLFGWLG